MRPGQWRRLPEPRARGRRRHRSRRPVDIADGRVFTIPQLDLVLPGPLPLLLHRSYSTSARAREVGLGSGWSHSLACDIEVRRRTIVVFRPNGTVAIRPRPEIGAEVDLGGGVRLRRDPEAYVLVDADGLVHLFERAPGGEERWVLGAIADLSGNRIVLAYRGRDLVSITDSVGRLVHVRRDAHGHIAAFDIDGGGGRCVRYRTYHYDSMGDLAAVSDGDGHAVRFTYEEHRLTRITYPGGLQVHHRYDGRGRCIETWCDYPDGTDPALADNVPKYLADGRTLAKGVLHCRFEYADGYTEVVNSLQVRRYELNTLGKATKATNGRGVATVAYDEHGHLTEYADENAASTI
jgi:YD repeat-containing protein